MCKILRMATQLQGPSRRRRRKRTEQRIQGRHQPIRVSAHGCVVFGQRVEAKQNAVEALPRNFWPTKISLEQH